MATDIDTTLAEHEGTTQEPAGPPRAPKPSGSRRVLVAWAAVVAACVAVAALAFAVLRGDDDDADFPATRLLPESEQVDRDAHLEGQQRTYGGSTRTDDNEIPPDYILRPHGQANEDFVPGSRRMPTR
ncbi:MAG TPA: hypothetical protein VE575_03160 [Acidimicrobiales bacterium]|jgi:hypothetical protein|nr:hypothetical protein [Acidimicrobiales bacterium]